MNFWLSTVHTYTSPSLGIAEIRENLMGWSLITHCPQNNKDGKESEDVNDKHSAFERRELTKKDRVEDDCEQHRANSQQHAMPCRHCVAWAVQCNHTLHSKGRGICGTNKRSLPPQDLNASQ